MRKQEVTLVTGASTGIGRAITEVLLAAGRQVVNIDHAGPAWSHPKLVSFQADLTREDQTRALGLCCSKHKRQSEPCLISAKV